MSNVVKFPSNSKEDNLVIQITNLQQELLGRFEMLTEHYVASRQLENECNELQERYDNLVLQYAAVVGSEHIPAGLLEYCTNVIAAYDGDTKEVLIQLDTGTDEEMPTRPKTGNKSVDEVVMFMDSITNFLRKKLDELQ